MKILQMIKSNLTKAQEQQKKQINSKCKSTEREETRLTSNSIHTANPVYIRERN
jgi:hypothetical protein